jgi:hypothetical protein
MAVLVRNILDTTSYTNTLPAIPQLIIDSRWFLQVLCYILQTVVWAGWLLAICFIYLSVILPSDVGLRHYRYDVNSASIYIAYSPITWSLALGWLIWACYTGNGGKYEIMFLADEKHLLCHLCNKFVSWNTEILLSGPVSCVSNTTNRTANCDV